MNFKYDKKYIYIIIVLYNSFVINWAHAGQLIDTTLHPGNFSGTELDFEPFEKINLSVSPKDGGKDCKVEICIYIFNFAGLWQFYFPLPGTIKANHRYENGKSTILLIQNSDIYDGLMEIQSCPRISRACRCLVSPVLKELNARNNLPARVFFSATYASKKFRCLNIISWYQWLK